MRTRLLLTVAVGGLASCNQPPAPPAAVATPAVVEAKADQTVQSAEPAVKEPPIQVADGGSFAFPDDSGGKSLAKSLTPSSLPMLPVAGPVVPRDRKLPAFVDSPAPPLPEAAMLPPRLALAPAKEPRPVPLPDRVPSDLGGAIADLPSRADVPTGSLTRTESRDVSRPAELPTLSPKPVPDRPPLTDPTTEFTAVSVISPALPLRTDPTGFVRINLPDPFENVDAGKVRTPVVEDPNRVLPSVPPPR